MVNKTTFLLTVIVITTMATSGLGQDDDPCAKVTCSNHGDCIFVEGRPLCACHEGYEADSIGLGCKPLPSTTMEAQQKLPDVKECSSDGDCKSPNLCYEEECVSKTEKKKRKKNAKRNAAWATLTPDEVQKKKKKSKDMIVSGSILVGLGLVSGALGATLMSIGVNKCEERLVGEGAEAYWDDGCSKNESDLATNMHTSGFIMATASAALLIPGVVVLAIGAADKKRLARNEPTIGFNPAWTDKDLRNRASNRSKARAGIALTITGTFALAGGLGWIGFDTVIPVPFFCSSAAFLASGIPLWVSGGRRLANDKKYNRGLKISGIVLTITGALLVATGAVTSAATNIEIPVLMGLGFSGPLLALGIPLWLVGARRLKRSSSSVTLPEPVIAISPETSTYSLGMKWNF